MKFAFRPKSFLHFSTLFSLLANQSSRCISSITPLKSPLKPTNQNPNRSRNLKPDYEVAIVSALKDYSFKSSIPEGERIHGHVNKLGLDSNIYIQNILMSFYSKCVLISSAKRIFDDCEILDAVSCNIMIVGYVKSGHMINARELFDKMPARNCVSFTTMIMGLVQNGAWREAVKVFKCLDCN